MTRAPNLGTYLEEVLTLVVAPMNATINDGHVHVGGITLIQHCSQNCLGNYV